MYACKYLPRLQVTVRNIHVRFEDSVTVPGKTMAGGITLDSLTVRVSVQGD